MLLISSQAFSSLYGETLAPALRGVAERSSVPCCLQLDHEQDLDRIASALEYGFGTIMADGSRLPFDENVSFARAAVELAERHGAQVEAELGHVAGNEEIAAAAARGALTGPREAADYVAATGVDCLAVSIGNVHGRYAEPPRLDWDRLTAVREAVSIPLSLHGASGIPDAAVRRAIGRGIAKVNVNTELRERYFDVLAARAAELQKGAQLLKLAEAVSEAVGEVVDSKLELFAGITQPRRRGQFSVT